MYTYALYAPILCCLPSNQWSSCLSSSPIVVAPVVDVEWSANFFLLQKSSVDFMDDARLRHSPAHSCKTSNGLLERFKGGKKRLAVRVLSSHNIDLSDVRRCFKMPGNAAPHSRRRHRGSGRASERRLLLHRRPKESIEAESAAVDDCILLAAADRVVRPPVRLMSVEEEHGVLTGGAHGASGKPSCFIFMLARCTARQEGDRRDRERTRNASASFHTFTT